MSESKRESIGPQGTFSCPQCGADYIHTHDPDGEPNPRREVVAWLEEQWEIALGTKAALEKLGRRPASSTPEPAVADRAAWAVRVLDDWALGDPPPGEGYPVRKYRPVAPLRAWHMLINVGQCDVACVIEGSDVDPPVWSGPTPDAARIAAAEAIVAASPDRYPAAPASHPAEAAALEQRIADKTAGFDPPGREWTAGDAIGLRRDTVEETIIEGWRCYLAGDGIRHAERDFGFTLRTVQLDKHGGLAGDYCYMPPAVIDWLIRPMLCKAWEAGVSFSHANPASLSDKLADNPHKDT